MKGSEPFPPAVGLGVAGQGRFVEAVPLTWTSMNVSSEEHDTDPSTGSTRYANAGKRIVRAVQVLATSLTLTVNCSRFRRGTTTLSQKTAEPG